MAYSFSSIQVKFNDAISKEFKNRSRSLILNSTIYNEQKDLGFSNDPHVTILTGIHGSYPSKEIIDIIESHPRFTVVLKTVSLFKEDQTGKGFDVVKVEIDCSDLFLLRNEFINVTTFTEEFPEYKPHVTIAFVKPNSNDHLEGSKEFYGMVFQATMIEFSSRGGRKFQIMLGHQ